MSSILVTGPNGFLGYHVVKALDARGECPRVLFSPNMDPGDPGAKALKALNVSIVEGELDDMDSLREACTDVDLVFHLKFTIAMGGGDEVEQSLLRGNVVGTRNLTNAAAEAGVSRMVVSSSSLAVGINAKPELLDENSDWKEHAFLLPYAVSRREAEQEALARPAGEAPDIVVINPSFTLGPDDYVGAPANSLVKKMSEPGFRLRAPIGFGLLDVRDYAQGALLAAERGRPGQRYLLSGENIDSEKLLQQVAEVAGFKPSSFLISLKPWYLRPIVAILNTWKSLRGQSSQVSPRLFDLWDRYAWYDTSKARNDLGWKPRALRESVQDTIEWQRGRSDV